MPDAIDTSIAGPAAGLARRRLLSGAAGACGALLLGGLPAPLRAASGPTADTVLRIADYKAQDGLALASSGQPPTPYRSQFAEFASGNLIVEAINAGSIDVGSSSEIPPAFGIAAGARFSIVAVVKDDVNWQVVLVPPGSPVRSVAELKGKRVGYVRATTTHYYLARMLGEAGLRFTDIEPVSLTPSEGQAAFEQGALDAWAIYGYSVPFAIRKGARVLVTSQGYLSGNYLYLASPDALSDPGKAAAIGDYFLRLRRAFAWRAGNLERWAQVHSAAIGVPVETDLEILRKNSRQRDLAPITDADVASAQAVADTFQQLGVLPRHVDVAPAFDRRFTDILSRPLS
ncbi:ABC transporter substrate-binding protein [Azospirillum picis]|uniref:Sulfonate transport system substrate-binding protein n=1 Tax=Azospirillum picis TaxID=488438 RepID=A0ABU0MMP2_9PROT|nr:ABC transporter substrate-binding protein [Azospirillum picis]MBP2300766.1 sulfonate transport system substrate-binding protein [Azospirillum picis]MDQ0534735.1 sulfonate transport system substrate-binding protein [Azospirillum picis]